MNIFLTIIIILQFQFSVPLIKLEGEMEQNIIRTVALILSGSTTEIPKLDKNFKPKLSIVIPVYNEENYIKDVLKSIQLQSLKEIEIIFIDDKSTDKSVKKIKDLKKEDPRIKLIKNEKNRGILYNRIYGGLQARGNYVTFIDADDLYANPQILEMGYNKCIENNLDILEFDYYGGRFDRKTLQFRDVFLFSNQNKNLYNKVYYQPEIKKRFFYQPSTEDILAGIVYNKIYSHREIERMADYMGKDFWNQHYIVFEMNGDKLKNPDMTNKKLGDYLSMWEKTFDLTENEKDSEYLRLKLIHLLKDPDNRHVFAQTYHYERIINLCKRMYKWKYSSDFAKKFAKDFALETIDLEIPIKNKYSEFFENELFGRSNNKNNNNNNKKKEKKKKKENKEKIQKEKKVKKAKIRDEAQIDGFIDDDIYDL